MCFTSRLRREDGCGGGSEGAETSDDDVVEPHVEGVRGEGDGGDDDRRGVESGAMAVASC